MGAMSIPVTKWTKAEVFLAPLPAGWPYGDPKNSWDDK